MIFEVTRTGIFRIRVSKCTLSPGQVADMKINLIIGVNVTLDILFKKEHIITPTSANMSARVRLFDDSSNLVAEWMSSEGTYTTSSGFAWAADGTNQYPFGNQPAIPVPKSLNTLQLCTRWDVRSCMC